MATEIFDMDAPDPAQTQVEMVLYRVMEFIEMVKRNRKGIVMVMTIIYRVVSLAFRYIPMNDNQLEAYNGVMGISGDVINIANGKVDFSRPEYIPTKP